MDILCTFLRAEEHVLIPVGRDSEAIKSLRDMRPDMIILEGTVGGTKVMTEARDMDANIAVVMLMGAPPSVEQVVELMNQGVSEVLVSPLDINEVQTKVERALSRRRVVDAVEIRFRDLVGPSPKMQQVFRRIVKSAASDTPILIIGEPGVGKKAIARQINLLSPRKDKPLRVARCRGLSEQELESELFGHEARAFSWAVHTQAGSIEAADGGALFLDEVADLTPAIQAKLLRFLEDQTLQRLGGAGRLSSDVRILAATIHPLQHRVAEGAFRSDLFYRLCGSLIEVPPLRARFGDIPDLVEMFLSRYTVQIAGEAMEVLMNYSWPGNVDELKNAVEQAVVLCEANRIELRNLPSRVLHAVAQGDRAHKYIPRTQGEA
jgi:DNA-binding NtrC family response regulator